MPPAVSSDRASEAPRLSGRKRRMPARLAEEAPAVKKRSRKNKHLNDRHPIRIPNTHKPCNEVLFLYGEHTVHWQPNYMDTKSLQCMANIHSKRNGNLHSYFITAQAAKDAVVANNQVSIFRHIGSVALHHFSISQNKANGVCIKMAAEENRQLVNICYFLQTAKCNETSLLHSLESLAVKDNLTWGVSYIVLLAKLEDIQLAYKTRDGVDIKLQVYAGRMLFELIACDDIKVLFDSLLPQQQHAPVPIEPTYPVSFPHSDLAAGVSRFSCEAVLRNAESTGHDSLTKHQRHVVEKALSVPLYPFQEQTVRWMLQRENSPYCLNDYFWQERFFTKTKGKNNGSFFYFPLTGEVRVNRPPSIKGGLVAEEMGLGKTIEALALIAVQRIKHRLVDIEVVCERKPNDVAIDGQTIRVKRLRSSNKDQPFSKTVFQYGDQIRSNFLEKSFPQKVKVSRWPAKTTLVVCPPSLLGQWRQEAISRAPSLSLYVWTNREHEDMDKSKFAVGPNAVDIVLTSYDVVRGDALLSMITWRRIILDEAQLTRRSATQIARDMFNLRSNTRFLMTGTPIVASLDDLKGELATLKVWPFTLENDGFWEKHVLEPVRHHKNTSLLSSLLKVTMIRHTKGQGLNLNLPERTYETIEVDLVGSHRSTYCYILAITLEELEIQQAAELDTRRLRLLLKFLLWVSLSPSLVDVSNLDIARRHTWARRERLIHGPGNVEENPEMRQLSATEAIEFVASLSRGIVRQTFRTFAVGGTSGPSTETSNTLDMYLHLGIGKLREAVLAKGCVPAGRISSLRRERLAALAAGGVHRLATDSLSELRQTVIEVGITSESGAKKLSRTAAMAKLQNHYDRLNGVETRAVHESGFEAISKLIERKGDPTCPVCLTECDERVTVTKCGHLYCHGCMSLLLGTKDSNGYYSKPRCAICRAELNQTLVAEIIRVDDESKTSTQVDKPSDGVLVSSTTRSETAKASKWRGRGRRRSTRRSVPAATENIEENNAPEFTVCTSTDAWSEYSQLGEAPNRFHHVSGSSRWPSMDVSFLRHLEAANQGLPSPKLSALLSLIESTPAATKFCVVAGSITSIGIIRDFLSEKKIKCVGVSVVDRKNGKKKTQHMTDASEAFASDAEVRVFLLNPSNSSGLNLIAAEYVIFMETLVRVADEIQAAARVHRIGQTKSVKVVRIVARNTIDEQIAWERRTAATPAEESQIMASLSQRDASDSLILRLFGHVLQQ